MTTLTLTSRYKGMFLVRSSPAAVHLHMVSSVKDLRWRQLWFQTQIFSNGCLANQWVTSCRVQTWLQPKDEVNKILIVRLMSVHICDVKSYHPYLSSSAAAALRMTRRPSVRKTPSFPFSVWTEFPVCQLLSLPLSAHPVSSGLCSFLPGPARFTARGCYSHSPHT